MLSTVFSIFTANPNLWVGLNIIFFIILPSIIYYYCTSTFGLWKKLNVPYVRPVPLFGNYLNVALGIDHTVDTYRYIYNQLAGHKYGGMFQMRTPYLMIRDPEMISNVLKRDFSYFPDRGIYSDFTVNPLSKNLFFMRSPKWKVIRNKLSPAFSSGKLKLMYEQIKECGDEMMDNIDDQLKKNSNEIEVRDILGKFSTDVIGTCIFGLKLNAVSDDNSEFRKYGKTLFQSSPRVLIRELCLMISQNILNFVKLTIFPKDAIKFFGSVIHDTIAYREENNIIRNDYVHHLMQARKDLVLDDNLPENEKFTESEIAANAFVMLAAGFETTSTALSFCLYELALNKHIQDKVREEIKLKISKYNGVIGNDLLNDLSYLDMVIAETLRKYPTTFALFRQASHDYHVPNESLTIMKDQKILIPIYSLHFDPKYFNEPEVFDPERFSPEEKAKRPSGVYLPFGDGPRICIGKRFSELEMKTALTDILTKYEVEPCEKTEIPVKFSKISFLVIPKNETVWLKFNPLSD